MPQPQHLTATGPDGTEQTDFRPPLAYGDGHNGEYSDAAHEERDAAQRGDGPLPESAAHQGGCRPRFAEHGLQTQRNGRHAERLSRLPVEQNRITLLLDLEQIVSIQAEAHYYLSLWI